MTPPRNGDGASPRRPSWRASVRRTVGRPSKLVPDVEDRFFHALRAGNARVAACRFAGISEATFHRWMTDPRPEFREFRLVVERAESEAEVAVVGNLVEASKRDYRAALAWLERRAPERWRLDDGVTNWPSAYPNRADAEAVAPTTDPERTATEKVLTIPAAYISDFTRYLVAAQNGGPPPVWSANERLKRFRETAEDDDD